MVADHKRRDAAVIERSIEELVQLADGEPDAILQRLRQLVPEYCPSPHTASADRPAAA